MISVSIMWPNGENASFDHDYYLGKHIPMLAKLLGDKLKKIEVDRGMGGREPGSPPAYVAITRLKFDSIEDFQTAFGPHADRVTGDESNFTNIEVQVQISEIVK